VLAGLFLLLELGLLLPLIVASATMALVVRVRALGNPLNRA
jgi:hypothetical protein